VKAIFEISPPPTLKVGAQLPSPPPCSAASIYLEGLWSAEAPQSGVDWSHCQPTLLKSRDCKPQVKTQNPVDLRNGPSH